MQIGCDLSCACLETNDRCIHSESPEIAKEAVAIRSFEEASCILQEEFLEKPWHLHWASDLAVHLSNRFWMWLKLNVLSCMPARRVCTTNYSLMWLKHASHNVWADCTSESNSAESDPYVQVLGRRVGGEFQIRNLHRVQLFCSSPTQGWYKSTTRNR